MNGKNQQSEILTHQPVAELLKQLVDATPKLVIPFTPGNGKEQKQAFLSGEITAPRHSYPKLEAYDFAAQYGSLSAINDQLKAHPEINPKYQEAYADAAGENVAKLRMLEIASLLTAELPADEHDTLAAEYMALNIELYGEPDEDTYSALVNEARQLADTFSEGSAASLAADLSDLLPQVAPSVERYVPQEATVEWIKSVADSLYAPLVAHVEDEKSEYDANDVRNLFEEIIRKEFGEAAAHWSVELSDTHTSIEVQRMDKKIYIPASRKSSTPEAMRGLVKHELGVHFLRCVMGEQTDLALMTTGLAGYADIEEGLGMVMQQSEKGTFNNVGGGLYLAASLAYFEKKTFQEVHEILWRKSALEKLEPGDELDDEAIQKAKDAAYGVTQRIFRGTDELPWFKDLSYLRGTEIILKHIESIRGDDLQLMFLLLGKSNPTNPSHVRTMLETKSI